MKQAIIDKFGLVKTNIHNGESFRNDITTYQHPRKDLDVYFSLGDPVGKRLKDGMVGIMVRSKTNWLTFQVPEKLLMDDHGEKYLNNQIEENLGK